MKAPQATHRLTWWTTLLAALAILCLLPLAAGHAQPRRSGPAAPQPAPAQPGQPAQPTIPLDRENVQADVSTRSVAVTSSFNGTEIVVFGAVDYSRQTSAEAGIYDIVIVLEGTPTRLVARRKSRVGGVWINTNSITFESVPSYYAIVSTRPLDELADPIALRENDIGFDYVRMTPVKGWETGLSTADLEDFKSSVIRLKQRDKLYIEEEFGVSFIGRSLFRATIELPANVPVGPLDARIYLFRDGRLLSTWRSQVNLRREGLERFLYAFAFDFPLIYGVFTVALSVAAGLAASAAFRRTAG